MSSSLPRGAGEKHTRVVILEGRALARSAMREAVSRDPVLEVVGEGPGDREGEALVLRTHPDVVVYGLNGPTADCVRLLRRLRRQGMTARVLLIAPGVDARHVMSAVEAGVDGYLLHDVSPHEFTQAVREVAEGAAPLHARVARVIVDEVAQSSRHAARAALWERGLSNREVDVLALLASGLRDQDIAVRLIVSKSTVKTHLRSIFRKLQVRTRVQAASIAISYRLIAPGETPDPD